MSDRNQARRTTAEVVFGGTDITSSIRPYLLSLTYTDNEEDEADDLQIKLQDRDSIWLEKWLNDAVQAAASSAPAEGAGEAEAKTYKVTPSIGLNVRTGPGTSYGKLGALPYGTEVSVTGISNGWATIQYSGKTAYVSAQYIQEVGGGQAEESSEASATTGLAIQAVFVRENWNNDGKDTVLDCGQFELDSIKRPGRRPPSPSRPRRCPSTRRSGRPKRPRRGRLAPSPASPRKWPAPTAWPASMNPPATPIMSGWSSTR